MTFAGDAGVFLEPADVGPADATVVLEVLNAATSAEELAATIELPGESDIGVRLAARLLRRRAELGGRFSSLAEVAAVPLIGPARFTDLVVALTGATPGDGGIASDLRAELAALRAEIAALRASIRPLTPTLWLRSGGQWLGEPARLVAGVADRRPGVPLLVVAHAGRLETTAGGTPLVGVAVPVTTGALGEAELTWVPPHAEGLDTDQRAALVARFGTLSDAADPGEAGTALAMLAVEYLREPARAFREAVDALWSSLGRPATTADPSARAWPSIATPMTVHALDEPASSNSRTDTAATAAVASAALVLQARNWLAPFAEALRRRVAATAGLASQLRAEAGRDTDAMAIGAAIQARIGSWVANRPGELAREVAVEVAQDAARVQLAAATQRPLAEREALVPLLSASARAVGQVPAPVLGALEATGSAVRRDVIDRISQLPTFDPGFVEGLAGQLAERVTVTQLDEALAGKLDRTEARRFEGLLDRVERLERDVRPP